MVSRWKQERVPKGTVISTSISQLLRRHRRNSVNLLGTRSLNAHKTRPDVGRITAASLFAPEGQDPHMTLFTSTHRFRRRPALGIAVLAAALAASGHARAAEDAFDLNKIVFSGDTATDAAGNSIPGLTLQLPTPGNNFGSLHPAVPFVTDTQLATFGFTLAGDGIISNGTSSIASNHIAAYPAGADSTKLVFQTATSSPVPGYTHSQTFAWDSSNDHRRHLRSARQPAADRL